MIHGYHVILTMYGYWLPNDPRGSWSDFVGRWELVRFGKSTHSLTRKSLQDLSPTELAMRSAAQSSLKLPPVVLNQSQTRSIALGFGNAIQKSGYTVWACSILPQHTHLVVARHTYQVEQIAILLKGAATKQIVCDSRHPFGNRMKEGRPPTMWASRHWKQYLDSADSIENAIHYVEENPVRENKTKQNWPFVQPFCGLDPGWTTYH